MHWIIYVYKYELSLRHIRFDLNRLTNVLWSFTSDMFIDIVVLVLQIANVNSFEIRSWVNIYQMTPRKTF
jgi:hypothetical protein